MKKEITPWEVKGKIEEKEYAQFAKKFGTAIIDDKLLERIKRHTKELHYLLRRKVFFSHRDLDLLLQEYEKGQKFFLYTGRGPSGNTHLGHLLPWIFTKWLQEKFRCNLYFQLTDDEKFLFYPSLTLEDTRHYAYENALDVIALGFEKGKTFLFLDTEYAKKIYPIALKIAKKLNFSTAKAVFGFNNATNVGLIFFTCMQSAPCFLEEKPCLIPLAIDQDPHFRITRDIAPKIGLRKPAIIHCKFAPGLGEGGKMSASQPETAIFTTDKPEIAAKKIKNAFSGGRESIEKQRKLGGRPEICSIYRYYMYFLEPDDKKLQAFYEQCKSGKLLCKECKEKAAEKIKEFLKKHQQEREKARKKIDKFMLK